MRQETETTTTSATIARIASSATAVWRPVVTMLIVCLVAVDPVVAQSSPHPFCTTDMAETLKNVFKLIQFGGPLIGGVVALGTTVAIPTLRRSDIKRELKATRNQAVIWGIIVAPLGTAIVQFLLNNVVAGGGSCGF